MSGASKSDGRLVVGGSPRARLLPPEIKAEAGLRSQRRGLAAGFAVVLLLVAGGYVFATVLAQAAQDRFIAATERTSAVLAEQAEYIEVRALSEQVLLATNLRRESTASEVEWQRYFGYVMATLPVGSAIETLTATASTPGVAPTAPASPLEQARIAEIVVGISVPTLPDVAAWLDALRTIPGYVDAIPGAVTSSVSGYAVSVTLHLNEDALYNRFVEVVEDPEATSEVDGESGEEE